MALEDGDYIKVCEKVMATLLADTGEGGLREGDAPPVKSIEARLPDEDRYYGKHEVPLVAVEVRGKKEVPAPNVRCQAKVFEIEFIILARGADRDKEHQDVRKIAHRLEKIFREQSASIDAFQGLAALIDKSEGVLSACIKDTCFEETSSERAAPKKPAAKAVVKGEIWIPCAFFGN